MLTIGSSSEVDLGKTQSLGCLSPVHVKCSLLFSRSVMSSSLQPLELQHTRLLSPSLSP